MRAGSRAMKVVLLRVLDSIRTSYWFIPTLMAAGSVLLVWVTLRVDRAETEWVDDLGWMYSGGPAGAREVLSTIASSMITVAGVVFSITIVALTLASQQFGPRLLYSFMRDRGNQFVLGTFIATFLYCLLALRTIYGDAEDVELFVPHLTTTVGVGLAVLSLGVLIYFIHHVSIAIQAPHVVAAVMEELHRGIDRLAGHFAGEDATAEEAGEVEREVRGLQLREFTRVCSVRGGYILAMDMDRLFETACEYDLLISLPSRQGQYLLRGEPLARVSPSVNVSPEVRERISEAISLGSRRTAIQDIEFSVDQLAEVAVRALSTGINDPYTATTCVDHLGSALLHLMRVGLPSPYRMDRERRPRLILERPLTFGGVVDSSLTQIRQHVGASAAVSIRMLELLAALVEHAPEDEHVEVLRHHAIMIHRQGHRDFPEEWDLRDLDDRMDRVAAAIEQRNAIATPAP
jgi:uncharacterized membrane protein